MLTKVTYTKPRMRAVAWLMLATACSVISGWDAGEMSFPPSTGKNLLAAVGMTSPMQASNSREQHALLSMVLKVWCLCFAPPSRKQQPAAQCNWLLS